MDWKSCIREKIAKGVSQDKNLIASARKVAALKEESADSLAEHLYIGKISLLYDSLREYLECIVLEKGYKIYNHECYTSFIKEILLKSYEGDLFDELRRVRNSINYYGKLVSLEEAEAIIIKLKSLISLFRK